jgi:hypothetical protein
MKSVRIVACVFGLLIAFVFVVSIRAEWEFAGRGRCEMGEEWTFGPVAGYPPSPTKKTEETVTFWPNDCFISGHENNVDCYLYLCDTNVLKLKIRTVVYDWDSPDDPWQVVSDETDLTYGKDVCREGC